MLQEFTQQIEESSRAIVNGIHTAIPGTIVFFDPEKCAASVQPNGKYVTNDGVSLSYPRITEVPVVFPFCQSTEIGMAFPVKKGDSCLIIVSEVELDEWLTGAESEGSLKFDLTNSICIPGLMKTGCKIAEEACGGNAVVVGGDNSKAIVSGERITLLSGGSEITVTGSGTAIKGDLTVTGNIITNSDVKAGGILFKSHVHTSSEPGSNTGTPK